MSQNTSVGVVLDRAVSIATLLAIVAVGWIIERGQFGVTGGASGQPRAQNTSTVESVENLTTTESVSVRRQGHPVLAIIEFSDFQCPFCGRYARSTYAQIERDFVNTGKVEYGFRNFPLEEIHPLAFDAAGAATCANEQGKFWLMRDRLFAHQANLTKSDLVEHARAIGLNPKRFATCLRGSAAQQIKADQMEAARLDIKSTPTFLIGEIQPDGKSIRLARRILGAQPYETFKAELDKMLAAPISSDQR